MKITYSPEDAEPQEFVFRPGKLMTPEAEALEECGGRSWATFEEFGERFMAGSLKARRAALWILLKRTDPKLRFSDLVLRVEELTVRYDEDELKRIRETIEQDDTLTDEERAEALAEVDAAEDTEPKLPLNPPAEDALGKDGPGDTPTNSESPLPDTEPSPSN